VHAFAAFFLTLVLAWQGGARKARWGLLAIAAAALAGGVGEALQGLLSERVMSMGDWLAHLEGCAAAAPLYLLCIGARWCESADLPVRGGRNGGQ